MDLINEKACQVSWSVKLTKQYIGIFVIISFRIEEEGELNDPVFVRRKNVDKAEWEKRDREIERRRSGLR